MRLLPFLLLACFCARAEEVKPTVERTQVTVRVHWMSREALQDKCAELGAWGGVNPHIKRPVGCDAFNLDTNTADIYAEKPREVDDERTTVLGHELLHALEGKYHSQGEL